MIAIGVLDAKNVLRGMLNFLNINTPRTYSQVIIVNIISLILKLSRNNLTMTKRRDYLRYSKSNSKISPQLTR